MAIEASKNSSLRTLSLGSLTTIPAEVSARRTLSAPCAPRRFDDAVYAQITFRRRCGADQIGLVGLQHVQGAAVRFRVDGYRDYAHLPASAYDANGDLAAIGDQNLSKHLSFKMPHGSAMVKRKNIVLWNAFSFDRLFHAGAPGHPGGRPRGASFTSAQQRQAINRFVAAYKPARPRSNGRNQPQSDGTQEPLRYLTQVSTMALPSGLPPRR